jgi:hypothetical protein
MLRDGDNTNLTVAARQNPAAPNALLPCHLQPCGMRSVDRATGGFIDRVVAEADFVQLAGGYFLFIAGLQN